MLLELAEKASASPSGSLKMVVRSALKAVPPKVRVWSEIALATVGGLLGAASTVTPKTSETVPVLPSISVDDTAGAGAGQSRGLARGDQQAIGVGLGPLPGRPVDLDAVALPALIDGDGRHGRTIPKDVHRARQS